MVQSESLRLMCVHAHPDDESSKGAATMARYAAEGVDVLVVTLTDGSRGSVLNPAMDRPEVLADITRIRAAEMDRAREILGVRQVFLGFVDSGLPEGDPLPPLPDGCFALEPIEVTTEALVREIRRFRPHVMTTYDENGGYPHPDHIMCHDVSMAAFVAAGDPVDVEARRRGLTLYAPDVRTPLHPPALSEGAASLLPDQVRPALLWTLRLDERGERAHARRRRRATSTAPSTSRPRPDRWWVSAPHSTGSTARPSTGSAITARQPSALSTSPPTSGPRQLTAAAIAASRPSARPRRPSSAGLTLSWQVRRERTGSGSQAKSSMSCSMGSLGGSLATQASST